MFLDLASCFMQYSVFYPISAIFMGCTIWGPMSAMCYQFELSLCISSLCWLYYVRPSCLNYAASHNWFAVLYLLSDEFS